MLSNDVNWRALDRQFQQVSRILALLEREIIELKLLYAEMKKESRAEEET